MKILGLPTEEISIRSWHPPPSEVVVVVTHTTLKGRRGDANTVGFPPFGLTRSTTREVRHSGSCFGNRWLSVSAFLASASENSPVLVPREPVDLLEAFRDGVLRQGWSSLLGAGRWG